MARDQGGQGRGGRRWGQRGAPGRRGAEAVQDARDGGPRRGEEGEEGRGGGRAQEGRGRGQGAVEAQRGRRQGAVPPRRTRTVRFPSLLSHLGGVCPQPRGAAPTNAAHIAHSPLSTSPPNDLYTTSQLSTLLRRFTESHSLSHPSHRALLLLHPSAHPLGPSALTPSQLSALDLLQRAVLRRGEDPDAVGSERGARGCVGRDEALGRVRGACTAYWGFRRGGEDVVKCVSASASASRARFLSSPLRGSVSEGKRGAVADSLGCACACACTGRAPRRSSAYRSRTSASAR